ncbi:MAG TPA: FecR domain-containing protein [Verrucomicrobiae bacterium]|nr:FecR domain-containing protein [Verrucomicrobiae bacterium]
MRICAPRGFPAIAALAVAAAMFTAQSARAQAAPDIAGSVKRVTGEVMLRRGAERLPVKEGMHLVAHDVLETPAGGSVGFILEDGTRVAMGANTTVEIDRFLFEPSQGRLSLLLKLVRGVLVYVSGKMAQLSPDSVRVETPVGVVGLRGTEVAIRLEGS